jgi:fructokinase
MGKPLIIGLGEILWDILPGGRVLGGAPANFAYHCMQLGADSYAVSAVGKDEDGAGILGLLDELHLSRKHIHIDEEHATGTVTVALDSAGHPSYTIHEHVAWDHIPVTATTTELFMRADAVCFGSLAQRNAVSRKAVRAYLDATGAGCLKIFDINLRQEFYHREILESSLEAADVLKLNDEELPVLSRMFSLHGGEDQILNALAETFGLKIIALTRGSEGSTLIIGKERSDFRSEAVKSIDTVGAGDSFTASIVMGYLMGKSQGDIHRLSSDLAAYVCTQKGATPGLPDYLTSEFNLT